MILFRFLAVLRFCSSLVFGFYSRLKIGSLSNPAFPGGVIRKYIYRPHPKNEKEVIVSVCYFVHTGGRGTPRYLPPLSKVCTPHPRYLAPTIQGTYPPPPPHPRYLPLFRSGWGEGVPQDTYPPVQGTDPTSKVLTPSHPRYVPPIQGT